KIRESISLLNNRSEESRKIIITTLIASAIVSVIGAIGFYLSMDKGVSKPLTPNSDWEMILLFLLSPLFTLVLKPVIEETLYWELVFNGLHRSRGLIPSPLIPPALFARLHPPLLAIPVFLAGIVLAWAYNRSGILIVPILVNAIFNGVIFFL